MRYDRRSPYSFLHFDEESVEQNELSLHGHHFVAQKLQSSTTALYNEIVV